MILHETCIEYFNRRLSEGWKCISLKGYNAVLLSPDGIRRELDLRNDVETLRPNAFGDETNLQYLLLDGADTGPADPAKNWQCVDETPSDELYTYVFTLPEDGWKIDLYNLPAHSTGSGTINKITLHFRVLSRAVGNTVKGAIKSNTTVTETEEKDPFTDFGDTVFGPYSQEWATNPADSEAWEWTDIDTLQIGINLIRASSLKATACTQVYVEVDYGWTGIIAGVTNPAKIMGVEVANIATVKGVASA